jgi:hypothetical protein
MLGSLVTWPYVTIGNIFMELAKRYYCTHDQQPSNYLCAYLVTKVFPIFHCIPDLFYFLLYLFFIVPAFLWFKQISYVWVPLRKAQSVIYHKVFCYIFSNICSVKRSRSVSICHS